MQTIQSANSHMTLNLNTRGIGRRSERGFTLAEVVVTVWILAFVLSGMIFGYITAARRTEWSGYSLAAQALAIQQLEQARSAKWDIISVPPVCEITNIPTTTWTNIDVPYSGTNYIRATNYTMISNIVISTIPPVSIYMVKVDTAWRFRGKVFTNSIANYFAPDR